MTLQEIAMRAAAALNQQIGLSLVPEVRSALRVRRERIKERYRIVYLSDLYIWAPESRAIEYNDRYYAVDSCHRCSECDIMHPFPTSHDIQFRSGRYSNCVCDGCYENLNPWHCEHCDTTYSGQVDSEDVDGELCCLQCAPEVRGSYVPSYHGAKRWWCDTSQPSYSFELELVSEERDNLINLLSHKGFDKVSWERDGSLPSESGLEILIQHRKTLHDLEVDTIYLVLSIKNKGLALSAWNYLSDGRSGCGMHLNSNRHPAWTRKKVMRLLYMVMKCKAILTKIAGRNSEQWANFPLSARDSGSRKVLERWSRGDMGKYLALRVGCDRMEWRLFRSTLSPDRIKLYCSCVDILEQLALGDTPAVFLGAQAQVAMQDLYNRFIK